MILEKLKKHAGKILFFAINILLIATGFLYLKQKKTQVALADVDIAPTSETATTVDIQALQEGIAIDRQQKIQSIANNPAVVIRQKNVAVTKIIPGVTRIVTVSDGSTKPTSSSSTTIKKITSAPASTPTPTPTPAKTTKTS